MNETWNSYDRRVSEFFRSKTFKTAAWITGGIFAFLFGAPCCLFFVLLALGLAAPFLTLFGIGSWLGT